MPICHKVSEQKKFDIIVIGGYSSPTYMLAMLYMKVKKLPFVLNSDGRFIREESSAKKSIKKLLISSAAWWICSGEYTKATLKHYSAKEDRIFIYPFTSIRQEDILKKPPTIEEKRLLKKELNMVEEKVILSVGQFIPRKGFDLLIKASKSIPDNVGVYIVGGKPTKEYIELVEKLKLERKVHFIDFKSKREIKKYYMTADLFVLPTREDIWGLVINEAMAHGLPIITTNRCIAGVELLGNGEGGVIVEVENAEKLADAMNTLIQNEELAKKMSERNLAKIREYTIENMAKVHLQIFQRTTKIENAEINKSN